MYRESVVMVRKDFVFSAEISVLTPGPIKVVLKQKYVCINAVVVVWTQG